MLRSVLFLFFLASFASGAHAQTVVCFGDSLTAGYGAAPGHAYPDYLRKDLAAAGYQVTIVNQGVSGDTTKDALARFPAVLQAHPEIVVLELGANDGLRGQPVAGIQQNLATMLRALQAHHIRVLLAGIYMPPNLGPDYTKPFDAMYPKLAKQFRVSLIPFLLQDVFDHDELMSADGIHPNDEGYERVAQTVLHTLTPMLKK